MPDEDDAFYGWWLIVVLEVTVVLWVGILWVGRWVWRWAWGL
jgi:hypothetical protein